MTTQNKNLHVKTLNPNFNKKNSKTTGCGQCQASCQSACKTSCTVANQKCENIENIEK
ncbi:MAG: six-cysteine ranthipeptide SCIFF [Oscillospiraceae bacterium]|nr:six-cysteine ranthipeptide SCIFF [Oscillospiraceae bacterium]